MFHSRISDIFSGYRAFTREAAAQIPITAAGFDVETELTLQALYRGLVIKEITAPYRARPEGSFSKLRTFSDGLLVLLKLFLILKSYKPLTFFGLCSLGLARAWGWPRAPGRCMNTSPSGMSMRCPVRSWQPP